jgi:tRNA A-37 threonylcarbamoyl transferase component Bud32
MGRGATARLELPSGRAARVKRLRRGGWTAPLWRDRFLGPRRALDNLRLSAEAGRRGVATPAPLALLIERRRPGLVRAWLAVDEIAGATDMRSRLASGRPPTEVELETVLRLVREMHDRGVEHRDLNLGNLLIRGDGELEAFVVDLDRGRLHGGALDFGLRQRALRRLERSYVKACHPGPASDGIRRAFYVRYAAGDRELARRLERGRRLGRVWIGLHRLGWRIGRSIGVKS